jgi:hypothetical protein
MNGVILSHIRRCVKNAPAPQVYARHGAATTLVLQPLAVDDLTTRSISLFFRVPLEQIGYVRAVVEAHEGLATVRSAAANRGEIEWLVPALLADDARALAAALAAEAGLVEIPRPADWLVEGAAPAR